MTVTISLPPRPSETPEFTADGQKVQEMGSTLRTSSSIFDDHGSFVGGKAKDSGLLDGQAAAAYAQALSPIGTHADACSLALRAAANAVLGHGDDLVDLKRRHQDLKGERERLARQVDELTARANPLPTDEAELRILKSDCDRCTDQVETYESDLVKWAEDLKTSEEKVAAALRGAMTERQVDQKYAGVADPADTARDSMPSSKDPKAIKAWWDGLTDEQRAGMTAAYPEIVGNTDGIPAADRSEANTISLDRDLAELGAIPEDQRTDDEQTRYDNAMAADDARTRIERARDPETLQHYEAQIYMYDPMAFGGDGAVAMAVGDLDTADNVSVNVPGLTTDMESATGNAESAINRQQAASFHGGTSTATMFWIGYDAPSGADSAGVAAEGLATAGGSRLADTLDGLNAMRPDEFHLTAIGHSYGSTTVGHAMTDHHPNADDVVLLGSPGAGDDADSADDLGVGSGHVFVGTNSQDLVGRLGQTGWVSPAALGAGVLAGPLGPLAGTVAQMTGAGLGHNPAEDDFGAVRFQAESTSRGSIPNIDDHVKYYDHDSESLANMAHIVNGQYDEVGRAEQVYDPWYRDPVDPESDRTPTAPDTDRP